MKKQRYRPNHINIDQDFKLRELTRMLTKGVSENGIANFFMVSPRTIRNWKKRLVPKMAKAFTPGEAREILLDHLIRYKYLLEESFRIMTSANSPALKLSACHRATRILESRERLLFRLGYYDIYHLKRYEMQISVNESKMETEMLFRNYIAQEDGEEPPHDIKKWKEERLQERKARLKNLEEIHRLLWS